MARLTGPLFSLDARGQLAKTAIYEKVNGTNYAKRYAKPNKPLSQAQINHRARVKALATTWRGLTAEDKATWATYCNDDTWNHYARFIDANTKRGSDQGTTITTWPPSEPPTYAATMTDDDPENPTGFAGNYTETTPYDARPTYTRTSPTSLIIFWFEDDNQWYMTTDPTPPNDNANEYGPGAGTTPEGTWTNATSNATATLTLNT
jgi:hypothetical protein